VWNRLPVRWNYKLGGLQPNYKLGGPTPNYELAGPTPNYELAGPTPNYELAGPTPNYKLSHTNKEAAGRASLHTNAPTLSHSWDAGWRQ
jgi:hypothetical protein